MRALPSRPWLALGVGLWMALLLGGATGLVGTVWLWFSDFRDAPTQWSIHGLGVAFWLTAAYWAYCAWDWGNDRHLAWTVSRAQVTGIDRMPARVNYYMGMNTLIPGYNHVTVQHEGLAFYVRDLDETLPFGVGDWIEVDKAHSRWSHQPRVRMPVHRYYGLELLHNYPPKPLGVARPPSRAKAWVRRYLFPDHDVRREHMDVMRHRS